MTLFWQKAPGEDVTKSRRFPTSVKSNNQHLLRWMQHYVLGVLDWVGRVVRFLTCFRAPYGANSIGSSSTVAEAGKAMSNEQWGDEKIMSSATFSLPRCFLSISTFQEKFKSSCLASVRMERCQPSGSIHGTQLATPPTSESPSGSTPWPFSSIQGLLSCCHQDVSNMP